MRLTSTTYRLCAVLMGLCGSILASAHPTLSNAIRHTNSVSIGEEYIDTTIELTFMGKHAEFKRRIIDANGDGRLESSELKAHGQYLLPTAIKQVRLQQGDTSLELIHLYAPEVIAGEQRDISMAPVTIRFSFFSRPAEPLKAGDAIELRDNLYAGAPGHYRLSVNSDAGHRVKLTSQAMASHKPMPNSTPPILKAQIISLAETKQQISKATIQKETNHV